MFDGPYQAYSQHRRPLSALAAVARLIKNKEDTAQVFRIIAALDGPSLNTAFERFAESEQGRHYLKTRPCLRTALMDHEWLASLPAESFGRAYYDFISKEGLSADGLQHEMDHSGERFDEAGPDRQYFAYRIRHSHDLFHILTGYGRDAIGEVSVLIFTVHSSSKASADEKQVRSYGISLIAALGRLKIRREFPNFPVEKCLAEARALGDAARPLTLAPWEDLLDQPLEEVRARYNIARPQTYLSIKDSISAADEEYRDRLAAAA
ncbi:putative uncharacterized protein [Parvularcula bermudensis HTCC2503]|uniref:Ubiquinone biosynthesis protein n=1 Tax=Parvularcula bermudensis (strain ATCC BAA-594 / HTCC2503 / KCTC 12087) TaxID=314260 RepID=E0TBK9_PARBH|nr:Coq4 family protein [Parvularcula bermudensis]ADM08384.1 putative uncharacterized protein [Parvularcula bermudensis HTCC2503]